MRRPAHSRRVRRILPQWLQIATILGFSVIATTQAAAQYAPACVDAGRKAQDGTILPPGLLLAVGRVESGRWDPQQRRVLPWPWVIDVAGQPRFFADKQSAVQSTRALLDGGQRNIDVGCFQISLLHHPFAFAGLEQAFDPAANAQYAANFLIALHSRYGNWADAVAAYHSADPARGVPYRDLVFAAWSPAGAVWNAPSFPSVHVWTPGIPGSAPEVINLDGHAASSGLHLPRVITPNR